MQLLTHVISPPQRWGLLKINPYAVTPPSKLPLMALSLAAQKSPPEFGLSHAHLHKPRPPWDFSSQIKGGDIVTGIRARAALIVPPPLFFFLNEGDLGGQVEQSHKTNPIIQEWFVPLSNSPSLSHSVYCGIISQLCFRKHRRFVFRWRFVLRNPFFALFYACCCGCSWRRSHFTFSFQRGTTCNLTVSILIYASVS